MSRLQTTASASNIAKTWLTGSDKSLSTLLSRCSILKLLIQEALLSANTVRGFLRSENGAALAKIPRHDDGTSTTATPARKSRTRNTLQPSWLASSIGVDRTGTMLRMRGTTLM